MTFSAVLRVALALTALSASAAKTDVRLRVNHGVRARPKTLTFYILSYSDPEYKSNFVFFAKHGLSPTSDYVVITQEPQEALARPLDAHLQRVFSCMPSSTIFMRHENACYDTGAFGWALKRQEVRRVLHSYDYVVVLNSSVRGPFLPSYVPGRRDWQRLLTRRLGGSNDVRMVGATISCEETYSETRKMSRSTPHVQTWLFAVDRVGLEVLLKDGKALACHADRQDAIWNGELGSSLAILDAGYNIDCLLEPYQSIDWRHPDNKLCNNQQNPMKERRYMGLTLSPYATIFTKYKQFQIIEERSEAAHDALVMSNWMDESSVQTQVAACLAS